MESNSVLGSYLLRRPQGNSVIHSVEVHQLEDSRVFATIREGSSMLAVHRGATFERVTNLGSSARNDQLRDVQSMLGRDEGHVVTWRTGGDVHVARYSWDTATWTTYRPNRLEGNLIAKPPISPSRLRSPGADTRPRSGTALQRESVV
jgi:hypothetical protein